MGGVEASCAVKLISNMVGMANLAVLAEGIRAGEKAGIERSVLVELLQDTGARSFQMDVRGPWIAAGDFENRFGLDLALKDVRLGCEMARAWGLDLKTMEAVLDLYKKASSAGSARKTVMPCLRWLAPDAHSKQELMRKKSTVEIRYDKRTKPFRS